jgi:bifunctional ADP-heptose synthase (sugar kinase/adenylyltransferase)
MNDWNSGTLNSKSIFIKLLDADGEEIQIDELTNEYEAISTISIINQNKQQLQRISGSSTQEYNSKLKGFLFSSTIFYM